jgi:hypothetical protein
MPRASVCVRATSRPPWENTIVRYGWRSSPGSGGAAAATVGDLAGDVNETTLTITFGMTRAAPTQVGIRCSRAAGSGAGGIGPNPKMVYAVIDAVEVGSVTTSEQT